MTNNLKAIRKSKGMTQTELAKQLGITVAHLNKIENNGKYKRNLTAHLALKAAKILDVSLDEIFFRND